MLTQQEDGLWRLESTPVIAYAAYVIAVVLLAVGSWATYYGCRGFLRGYGPDWDAIYSGAAMLFVALILFIVGRKRRKSPPDCVLFCMTKKRAKIIRSGQLENEVEFAEFLPLTVKFIKSKRPQGIGHYELFCASSKNEVYFTSDEADANSQKEAVEKLLSS